MTTMISEVYEALRSIGVDEPKASAAAAAMSIQADTVGDLKLTMESRFTRVEQAIEARLNRFELATETRFTRVERDIAVLKWMCGGNTALMLIILGKLLLMH